MAGVLIVADLHDTPMHATRGRRVKTDRRAAQALMDACRLGAYRGRAGPVVGQLKTVLDIGPVTAPSFVAALDRVERFRGPPPGAARRGLVPGERSSGEQPAAVLDRAPLATVKTRRRTSRFHDIVAAMIPRFADHRQVAGLLGRTPIVAILGARQVGKSTLARQLIAKEYSRATVFDLERSDDLAALSDPLRALESLRGLVIIDEVQRRPDLFPTLRVLADRRPLRARFLVLGSASPNLLRQSSESLAGRIAYYELGGLSLEEVGSRNLDRLWLRGGFPRSYLARSAAHSAEWRENFTRTYLERDVPELGIRIPSGTLRRFWSMLAHWHGQVWNASEFGRSFGVSDQTVRRYLDVLTQTYVVRQLLPWHENIAKRQVKSPRVYIADSGLLHSLLGVDSMDALGRHPKVGASWEGFAMAAVVHHLGADSRECFFWRAHTGAELDLLVVRGRHRFGFEFKLTSAPATTPSSRAALEHLKLDRLDVVHAGRRSFPLGERIRAIALSRMMEDVAPLDRAAATRRIRASPGRSQ